MTDPEDFTEAEKERLAILIHDAGISELDAIGKIREWRREGSSEITARVCC